MFELRQLGAVTLSSTPSRTSSKVVVVIMVEFRVRLRLLFLRLSAQLHGEVLRLSSYYLGLTHSARGRGTHICYLSSHTHTDIAQFLLFRKPFFRGIDFSTSTVEQLPSTIDSFRHVIRAIPGDNADSSLLQQLVPNLPHSSLPNQSL